MLSVYADYVAGTIPETAVIGVKLCLRGENAAQRLDPLQGQREAIEQDLGLVLTWNPFPEKRTKTVTVVKPCNLADELAWPECHQVADRDGPRVPSNIRSTYQRRRSEGGEIINTLT